MTKFTEEVLYVDGHKERVKVRQDGRFTVRTNPMIINDYLRRRTVR